MPMSEENDEFSALMLKEEGPLYGRFTLQVSDAYILTTTETQRGVRLDFRRRTLRERLEVWRRKWGL